MISSRIDKGFINEEMLKLYPNIMINYHPEIISDHTPLVARLCQQEVSRGRPFKFLNIIAPDDRLISTIQGTWQICSRGNKMKQVWENLKHVKQALKSLHFLYFSRAHKR